MAGLKTQGFALSALPRSPNVPNNIGKVDVKEIYDGTRRALESFEAVRTAPQSMLLADTIAAEKTAQAPLTTRGLLAQTEAAEQQLPLKTALLAAEAEGAPAMVEAKRQALLNRGMKQPSGDVQLAQSLANARLRYAEDPNDAAAAQLIAVLEPMAVKKSAASMANPQGAIDAGLQKATETNATRVATNDANITSREGMAERALSQGADLKREGFTNAQDVAKIGAQGRIDAARAQFTGKVYESAAQKNEKVNEELAALKVLDQKVDAYKNSALGSGVVVGSAPAIAVRSIFGDNTGKDLAAATALSMRSAVETMRGLGAMSEKEFTAAMSQLPTTSDPAPALQTKMDYLNIVRPWIAARNTLFLERLEAGDSPMKAHEAVRKALPLVGPDGNIVDPIQPSSTQAAPAAAPALQSGFKIIEVR